jgi:beta-lactamase superfamily II metal-dependent hydrolase
VFMSFWIVNLEVFGKMQSMAKTVIKSGKNLRFRTSSEAKYFHKVRKSCPVLSFGELNTFTVKQKTVLNFVKGISKGTFRALIALN